MGGSGEGAGKPIGYAGDLAGSCRSLVDAASFDGSFLEAPQGEVRVLADDLSAAGGVTGNTRALGNPVETVGLTAGDSESTHGRRCGTRWTAGHRLGAESLNSLRPFWPDGQWSRGPWLRYALAQIPGCSSWTSTTAACVAGSKPHCQIHQSIGARWRVFLRRDHVARVRLCATRLELRLRLRERQAGYPARHLLRIDCRVSCCPIDLDGAMG